MQPASPGPWLRAAAVALAVDIVACVTAWATWRDRVALLGVLAGTLTATALACWLWSRAVERLPLRRVLFGLPFAIVVGVMAGQSATLARALGVLAVPCAIAGALGFVALLAQVPSDLPRWLLVSAGALCLTLPLALPRRLYPSLRAAALMAGLVALAHGFARRKESPPIARAVVGLLSAIVIVLFLQSSSANVRFVSRDRPPATGLVLAALSLEAPAVDRSVMPVQPVVSPGALGDAHFLLITVDALRADRRLPQAMARAHGVLRWTHAYAQAPHTAFSITSLLTGAPPDRLAPRPPTVAEILKARRWFTQAWYPAGLFFDGRRALEPYAASRFGFAWADLRTIEADALTDSVLERVAALKREGEPRAFLWAHYFDPHEPYEPRDGTRAEDPAERRYDGEIAHVDRAIARLLDGLAGLERPVLVAITGDHGEEFGEHGGAYHGSSLYDEQLRVPLTLFVSGGRGRALPDATLDAPSELAGVIPTALAMLDVRDAPPMPSLRLWPAPERAGDVHAQVHSRRMLLRGSHKLIHETRGDIDELYDLESDPAEHRNLADSRPELRAELALALRQRFGLETPAAIGRTLADRSLSPPLRAAAARELGEQEATSAAPVLRAALGDSDAQVAAEAALALGALSDRSATEQLVSLLDVPLYRKRAALMLGRLRDPRASAGLRDTLLDIDVGKRRHACHYLGFVGGADAIPPLITRAVEDQRIRNDAYLALGRIAARTGDSSAVRFLTERLTTEDLDDARAHALWGLGLAGPTRSADAKVIAMAASEPPAPLASEALVRLGALAAGSIGGVDFAPESAAAGLDACTRRHEQERFDASTACALQSTEVHMTVPLPRPPSPSVWMVVRARALRDGPLKLRVALDGHVVGEVTLGPTFGERRLGPIAVRGARSSLTLTAIDPPGGAGALAELDHVLLLPAP
jgi:HEAT repeat protein